VGAFFWFKQISALIETDPFELGKGQLEDDNRGVRPD
jgi:hypothetical protein